MQTQSVYAAPNNSPSKIARDVQTQYFPDADKTMPLIVMVTNSPAVTAPNQVGFHALHPQKFRV